MSKKFVNTAKPITPSTQREGYYGYDKVSPYLLAESRILREACRELRHDDGGRRCSCCCVREFCEGQARRAAAAAAR